MRQRQTLLLRPSTDADLPAITEIYGDAVRHGTGTFELEPPDAAEIGRRRADVLSNGLPYLVAQASDGRLQLECAGAVPHGVAIDLGDGRQVGVGAWAEQQGLSLAHCKSGGNVELPVHGGVGSGRGQFIMLGFRRWLVVSLA